MFLVLCTSGELSGSMLHVYLSLRVYAFLPLQILPLFELQSCVRNYQTKKNVVANNPTRCENKGHYYFITIITSTLHSVRGIRTILTKAFSI